MQHRANGTAALGRTLIIANPAAQSGAARDAAERVRRFFSLYAHGDASFELVFTDGPHHAVKLAAGAAGYRTVVALGGDGIVHETVCGLMQIERAARPVLGVIPVGSGNDYARTLGLPADLADHAEQLLAFEPRPMDIGRIEYRSGGHAVTEHFAETFSFGLDAAIAIDTVERRQRTGLTGGALYTASGLDVFGRRFRTFPARVHADGADLGALKALIFAVQIGPTYGSGFRICPKANPSDGLFDVCYAAGRIPRAVALPLFLRAKNGGHVGSRLVHFLQARELELDFEQDDYPIQADGEQIKTGHARLAIEHHALQVLQPRP